uniref:Serine/threonine-protein phosphatase n=1 Tax=Caenorhabditis tropicalis TaxID=1561998 RepID=A0A1I7TX39_9PELO
MSSDESSNKSGSKEIPKAEAQRVDLAKVDPKCAEWMDDCIRRLNTLYNNLNINICNVMSGFEIIAIVRLVENIFMDESNLCEAEAPIKVVGDIHAQYQDLNRLFDLIGRVPEEKLMFLGDYVDRGPQGIEVLMLLFCLKIRYRDRIYLLRGNHETPSVNKIYGFYVECQIKYGVGLWWDFQSCFNRMPMAGLISKKVLCMHGGLSPELVSLDTIRNIARPCEPLDRGLLIDLLWSDPTNKGISYMFGRGVVDQACKSLEIDLIIRAHQVVQDGYEMMAGRRLITVFSVPNYCAQFTNAAAVVCLNGNLEISFQQMLPPPLPPTAKAKAAPAIANDPNTENAKADKDFIKPFVKA